MARRAGRFAAILAAACTAAIAGDGTPPAAGPVPYAGTPLEGNPYSLEWLARYHGMVDNRWTAQYEQWLQGDAEGARATGKQGAPEDVLGVDVRMSSATFNSSQNEFQIVVNPTDPTNAIGSSNDSLTAGVGLYRTTNGGTSWTAIDAPIGTAACCDPGVAFASDGSVYAVILDTSPAVTYVIRSTDKGATWGAPVSVATPDRENITVDNGACSPRLGRIYITYSDTATGILGYYSTNNGATWSPTARVSGPKPANGYQQSSDPIVASDGTLYVGYQEYENSGIGCSAPVRNWLARSTDGGASFTQFLVTGAAITQGGVCLSSQAGRGVFCINAGGSVFRSRSHPIVSVKPTDPATVYVVYSGGDLETTYTCGGGTGFHSDILFVKSTDAGATWSSKLKINTDPQGHDQYFPWISTTPGGTIWVGWHDRRNDPNNFTHEWYQAYSTNEGATWTESKAADVASLPATFIGDYAGMAASNTSAMGMWWDARIKTSGDPYTDPTANVGCSTVITISPSSLPSGTTTVAYSQTLTSAGGTSPYTYAVQSGALPPGLALSAGGVLSGTPTSTSAGTYTFTVRSTAANGCLAIRCYTLTIVCDALPPGTIGNTVLGDKTGGMTFTWANVAGEDFYDVYESATPSAPFPSGWTVVFTAPANTPSWTTSLGSGDRYFRVRARDACGNVSD